LRSAIWLGLDALRFAQRYLAGLDALRFAQRYLAWALRRYLRLCGAICALRSAVRLGPDALRFAGRYWAWS